MANNDKGAEERIREQEGPGHTSTDPNDYKESDTPGTPAKLD